MKRVIVLGAIFSMVSLAVSAQGLYFDIGLGLGKGRTEINGVNALSALKEEYSDLKETAVDIGLKAGYGPFGNVQLYVVGELAGMGHRIYNSSNYIQFNSYIVGPGVIFYPIPLIQLGASIGYSSVSNLSDMSESGMYDSKGGFAWSISAAFDLGKSNHGCLIGVKSFTAKNTLRTSNADEKASMFAVFIKYAYRKKTQHNLKPAAP